MERFGTVAIVGVGLIGGSVGLTLRARGLADRVVGVGRDTGRLDEAVRMGAIEEGFSDLETALSEVEVAVICTPVSRLAEDCRNAARLGNPDLLVTDAGSTKAEIVGAVESDPVARSKFVGAHPIAGSERSGVSSSIPDLFAGRACVLTPTDRTPSDRRDRARKFWASLGCKIAEMDPKEHDDALARTSHLPHVLASALAGSVPTEWLGLVGGAFRDGTRVASSDASLWADIFLANRSAVLDSLDDFDRRLAKFREGLIASDHSALVYWWNDRPAMGDSR